MGDIVNLSDERDKREAPDDEHVTLVDGQNWYRFGATYKADGKEFSITFWAKDMQDASLKVEAIKETLTLMGQIMHVEE